MAYLHDLKYLNGQWRDTFSNDTIYGTAADDVVTLYGGNDFFNDIDGGNDWVYDTSSQYGGWSGSDVISTGLGTDTVVSSLDSANSISDYGGQGYYGGLGIDTLNFVPNQTGVYVRLDLNYAQNNITGERTQVVGFENVSGSQYNDWIYGDSSFNDLKGGGGNDYVSGGANYDFVDGGDGNDQVFGGDGNDLVQGGYGDDLVSGDAGNDSTIGGYGNDRLYGGTGNDYMNGGDGNDFMNGQAGNDLMYGLAGNDQMYGGSGNDSMNGGLGNDMLDGSVGRDYLTGGGGADKFVFRALGDSLTATPDTISDFQHNIDKIDVFFIDARANRSGDQAFNYIGDHGFSNSGQIKSHYFASTNTTVVSFNTDTDSAAEMVVNLTGNIALSASDFIL